MVIFILVSLGIAIVLLIAYIGKRLGGTMTKDEMRPWKDNKMSAWKKVERDLDNDPHVIGSAARSIRRLFRDD